MCTILFIGMQRYVIPFENMKMNLDLSRGNLKTGSMSVSKELKRVTTHSLQEMKAGGEPIAMLTAYDYSTALILDGAGIDVLLVGDSASNVMAGHETTLPITLDQMIYHAPSVIRAAKPARVGVDIPFGSYPWASPVALRAP